MLVDAKGFNCQACGKRGSLLTLYRKLEGKPLLITLEKKQRFSWRIGAQAIWEQAYSCMQSNPSLAKYLTSNRGLTAQTVSECKIGYWKGWYIIPIFKAGEFQGAIARPGSVIESSCERYSNSPGEAQLYAPNENKGRSASYVLVPFGILDAISLYQCGFPAITWIAGKHIPSSAFDLLRKKIFLIPDKDEEREGRRLAGELGWRGQVISLNYGSKKDSNDFLRGGESKNLIQQIKEQLT